MTSLFRHSFNISSVYTAILRYIRFHGRHLDFRQNDTVDFVGDGTIEKPTPENIGVDTKIMFLSCRIAEIEGRRGKLNLAWRVQVSVSVDVPLF